MDYFFSIRSPISWGSEQSYAASIIKDENTPALAKAEDNAVKKYSTSKEMVVPYKEARPASYDPAPGTSTFVYDGDGRRVKKTEGGETILYINQYYEKNLTTGEVTTYYYSGGIRIAMRKGSSLQYMHQDHLTGTAVMTDASGAQVGTAMKYLPFGGTRSGSIPTDIKFTGQRLDSTGLYYFNARYYDPVIGRFISADPFIQVNCNSNVMALDLIVNAAIKSDYFSTNKYCTNNPQCLNRYSYVTNNSLKYIDPYGWWVFSLSWGVAGGCGLGFIASVGFAIDGHGNFAFVSTYGGGGYAGFGANFDIANIGFSLSADSVYDSKGPALLTTVDFGEYLASGSVSWSSCKTEDGRIINTYSGSWSCSVGCPVNLSGFITNTNVVVLGVISYSNPCSDMVTTSFNDLPEHSTVFLNTPDKGAYINYDYNKDDPGSGWSNCAICPSQAEINAGLPGYVPQY